jgi:hypothetical protein
MTFPKQELKPDKVNFNYIRPERRKGTCVKPKARRLRGSIVAVMQAAESGLCRHETTTH